jgi:hypothetical protein
MDTVGAVNTAVVVRLAGEEAREAGGRTYCGLIMWR